MDFKIALVEALNQLYQSNLWSIEDDQYSHFWQFKNKSGAIFGCRPDRWDKKDFYQFYFCPPRCESRYNMSLKDWRIDYVSDQVFISKKKTVEVIAKELKRRLLDDGIKAHAEIQAKLDQRNEELNKRISAFKKACALFDINPSDEKMRRYNFEATEYQADYRVTLKQSYIDKKLDYSIELTDLNFEQLEQIAKILSLEQKNTLQVVDLEVG